MRFPLSTVMQGIFKIPSSAAPWGESLRFPLSNVIRGIFKIPSKQLLGEGSFKILSKQRHEANLEYSPSAASCGESLRFPLSSVMRGIFKIPPKQLHERNL
jgi:hypothetical protein